MSEYTIRGGAEARSRLTLLSELLAADTAALFDAATVPAGSRCLDVGCGGGHLTFELARRTGPSGRVVGVDLDAEILDLARRDAREQGLGHVEFRRGDARNLDAPALDDRRYDIVHCRFVLSHLARPAQVVAGMAAVLAPGGRLLLADIDMSRAFWDPERACLARMVEIYVETVRRRGGDPCLGPRLPRLLREAGLEDVRARVAQPVGFGPPFTEIFARTLEQMAVAVVAEDVAGPDEVEALCAAIRELTGDGETLAAMPLVVQAWGTGPGGSSVRSDAGARNDGLRGR